VKAGNEWCREPQLQRNSETPPDIIERKVISGCGQVGQLLVPGQLHYPFPLRRSGRSHLCVRSGPGSSHSLCWTAAKVDLEGVNGGLEVYGGLMPDPEPISLAEIRLSIASITVAFAAVRDPRRDHLKRFLLPDMLVLAVAGMLAGCKDWVDLEDFGEQRAA
jgi:hypothetical protein